MTQDYPTAPLASEEKRFGTEGESHADTPTAPCEECHIPLELDISIATPETPRTRSQRHLCASCRRDLDREKWLDPKDDIRGSRKWW